MTAGRSVRIALADDHPIFRDGLRRLLETEPHFTIVGEAADGLDANRMVTETQPDVLLLDVAMPRLGGIEALATMPAGSVRVLLLTAAIEPGDLVRALTLGARGAVLKESATRLLIDALHHTMAGRFIVGGAVADDLETALARANAARPRPYQLTTRELEIVAAVAAGESNREIATRLCISLQTVKHHLTNVFDKTGVSTRLELALLAVRRNLTS